MADGLSTSLNLVLGATFQKTVQGFAASIKPSFSLADSLVDGVGLDQCDVIWSHTGRTIAGSATQSLDLSGGLTDPFGDAATFAKVKALLIHNKNVTAGHSLKIGGGSNPFLLFDDATDVYELGPGGIFFVWEPSAAGLPVTAGTGDLLRIVNQVASEVTFDIAILGTSS